MNKNKNYTNRNKSGNNNSHNSRSKGSGNANKSELNDQSLSKSGDRKKIGYNDIINDPAYYFTSTELLEQASQLSFQNFIGQGAVFGGADNKVPAVFNILVNPAPGTSYIPVNTVKKTTAGPTDNTAVEVADSGANLMAHKLYTLLAVYSGRTQSYAPQDVLTMILGISSIAATSEYLRRAFGCVLTYNARNRYVPLGLLEAMGIDSMDLIANLADYRMRFNVEMTRINQIPLLDNVGYIRKSRNIYQNIFADSASSMAQLFFYSPLTEWTIDEESYEDGTVLKTTAICHCDEENEYNPTAKVKTMAEYLNILSRMIDKMLDSSTLNVIYADLLNLANKVSVPTWQFDYLAENYAVLPVYNREALLQLHNLTITGRPYDLNTNRTLKSIGDGKWTTPYNDVFPDVNRNGIIYNPSFLCNTGATPANLIGERAQLQDVIVDLDTDQPTLADRVEALRFTAAPTGYTIAQTSNPATAPAGLYSVFNALPDHYVVAIAIGDKYVRDASNLYIVRRTWETFDQTLLINLWQRFSKLSWAPLFYRYQTPSSGATEVRQTFGDLNYFTSVDAKYINRLLRVVFTGLFEFRIGSVK